MPPPILLGGLGPELQTSLHKELVEAYHDLQLQPVWKCQAADLLPRFARYYAQLTHLPRRVRRSLQRNWKRSLAAMALLLALGRAPALAATLPVTTTNPNINGDGFCSLIEAIDNANADAQTHADCPAGSGADTIELPAGSTQTLTTAYGGAGLPVITTSITIEGHSSTIERAGSAPNFRIFAVNGDLSLNETTVSGGRAVGLGASGGGIRNTGGTVTLNNSTVSGNGASYGGGGVYNTNILIVTNSRISGNSANRGGGVYTRGSAVSNLNNSTISGNSAANGGSSSDTGTACESVASIP